MLLPEMINPNPSRSEWVCSGTAGVSLYTQSYEYEKKEARDNALMSMDAEKAFDRIEWPFLFKTMKLL